MSSYALSAELVTAVPPPPTSINKTAVCMKPSSGDSHLQKQPSPGTP
ncbi:MAG: hypothetical protein H6658_21145 [Ardenticatenaceae bacterium]|nr:hypothetical protein [Ardenticatenaceae bacterium]